MVDRESAFSMNESRIAVEQAQIISKCVREYGMVTRETVITDGTALIGGNVFEFGTLFKGINAIEVDSDGVQMLANNVEPLGLSTRVGVWHGDISKVAVAHTTNLRQDFLFLDPPWGGPDYWKQYKLCLLLNNMSLCQVCNMWANSTRLIALKLPCNFDYVEFFHNTNPAEPRKTAGVWLCRL